MLTLTQTEENLNEPADAAVRSHLSALLTSHFREIATYTFILIHFVLSSWAASVRKLRSTKSLVEENNSVPWQIRGDAIKSLKQ